ncbi:phosphodiester glycosidase family protein [Pedobacter sandarakinus]|uniref:phosphodiester glycosidase family protein n=1 Tax=Pedobacter sandarakinus TaxID=353156 RepID=UPI0022453A42|nr:phosphodiester glycosidase family protein [Pedobacter sandarakinus]MCX2573805.1 phosphodiester glycosidase family protein [Pedobacter sandarakinus]
MFKKSISALLLSCLTVLCYAQQTDSLTVVKARWKKTKISNQVALFQHHFDQKNLFGANENISFVEVKNTGRKAIFAFDAEPQKLITTSDFGKRNTAIVAINGNFFDVKDGGSVDFVRVDGQVINTNRLAEDGSRARHQQAAVVIDGGKLAIKKWNGSATWESDLPEKHVLLNGPLLTFENTNEILDTTSFTRLRHPRTCIGMKPNGKIIMLTADGRNDNAAGMSLLELTKVMRWLGCSSAINFDGGGSTTLWVDGQPDGGVINYPTDNKLWDHNGQRKVANVLLVKKK